MPSRFEKARVRGNTTKYEMKGAFYQSLKLTLKICRYLGFLPISGMVQSTGEFSSIQWMTPYTLLYIPSITLQSTVMGLFTYDYIFSDYKIRKLGGLLFFVTSFLESLILLNISKNWKNVLREIELIEESLPPPLNPRSCVSLGNWLMGIILGFGLFEYIIYLVYTINMLGECQVQRPDDSGIYLKTYFTLLYYWVYTHISFSYTSGIIILATMILQLSELQSSFVWNAVDAFIVVSCIYLANVFRTYNHLIEQKRLNLFSKNGTPSWSDLQVHYTRISRLVAIIDDNINPLIFISFSSNLISICQQLFYMLNKLTRNYIAELNDCRKIASIEWDSTFCVTYTFIFIVGRTMLVSFFAAEVHTLSREPLNAFNVVPSAGYNEDMKRLMTQVYYSKVNLSGLHFFRITRGKILVIVGTLMTYELVLLQI